ncbi:MAG TPA: hypothetical protein VF148_06465 [Acidimicrobiia bacterium]
MTIVLAVMLASVTLMPAAFAASAHFIRASASLNNDGSLDVDFKIAGLGDSVNVEVTATADSTATYACVNRGGKNPNASNKQDEAGPLSESGDFESGKNGQVTDSLTLGPLDTTLECPGNQQLVLVRVSYSNVMVSFETETGETDTIAISGTFSDDCLLTGQLASVCNEV